MATELNLTVDENNLLNEWKGQAALMLEYGTLLADAMQEEDEAKAALAVKAAELERDIRSDPGAYDVERITETAVAAAIPVQPDHAVAMKKLNKARHGVRVLRAAVDALAHRKSTLQGMTDLWLRQWYADPTSTAQPGELRAAADGGPPTKAIKTGRRRVRRPKED